MKNNKFALQIIAFSIIVFSFNACDKDFATLESDVISDENATNFDILSEPYDVIAYTKALGPVQTNGLGLSTLGVYDDLYGRTTSSFVTQVTTSSYNPDFGDEVVIDSVSLTIPYFNDVTGIDDNGNTTYKLDSVISKGENYKPINLRIFESNYFIRDFDPNASFNEPQAYFSNKSASSSEMIADGVLEGEELTFVDYDNETGAMSVVNNQININNSGHVLKDINNLDENGDKTVLFRQPPGIRIMLDPTFWQNKIIDKEGDPVLSSQNNFADYFRGLYFKAEPINNDGSFLILNTGSQESNITIYYTHLTPSTTDGPEITEQATYVLNFNSNKINFMDNDFTTPIANGNPATGDSRIYLKGGQGSVANIKLFNGDDIDDNPEEDNAFETFKNAFVETDPNTGDFIKSKRIVNEANLVFYVDRDFLDSTSEDPENEPNRIFVYDIANKTPLFDYFIDATNSSLPSFSKFSHLGPLQRVDDDPTKKGIKYKLKITDHINNLLLRDSTNVELGLAVSLNVNLEDSSLGISQRKVQNDNNSDISVPISSVLSPRGTVLYGNNTTDESKKVYLEIYYTEPN